MSGFSITAMKMRQKVDALDALTAVLFTQMERGSSRDVIMILIMENGWRKLRIVRRRIENGRIHQHGNAEKLCGLQIR